MAVDYLGLNLIEPYLLPQHMDVTGKVPTPYSSHFRQPAEWETHYACWLAWPSHEDLWLEGLEEARSEFVALCRAIAGPDAPQATIPEKLEILVPDEAQQTLASQALAGLPVHFHLIRFGDIWLRDTAPIFLTNPRGGLATVRFRFNGWGEKYVLPDDAQVSTQIAEKVGGIAFSFPWVLEGGSIEVDGEGTGLTTRQCLLNPNRNPSMTQESVEKGLRDALGIEKVLWLDKGLLNDHTDGHIDTLARFVAPGVVLCMEAQAAEDPNHAVLEKIAQDLASFTDAQGRSLTVVRIPSPGKILNEKQEVLPASYVNFYIGNRTVVVPTYGTPQDAEAVALIGQCFPDRQTVGLSARAILRGGGAFHCITQQQPIPMRVE
jgi:agmatine deiminase